MYLCILRELYISAPESPSPHLSEPTGDTTQTPDLRNAYFMVMN